MPVGTPFHERTFALSASLNFREWAGYYAAGAYETHHEHEYNAIRNEQRVQKSGFEALPLLPGDQSVLTLMRSQRGSEFADAFNE